MPLRSGRAGLSGAAVIGLALAGVSPACAQEPGLSALRQRVRSEELSIMVLLQSTGEYDPSARSGSRSGFRVANARVALSGELAHRKFSYLVQGSFVSSPSLLDLRLGYHPVPELAFEVGQFKAPFSQEALIGAGSLEFTERAPVVSALAPGRQLGGQLRVSLPSGAADFAAGGFNGNGQGRATNDDDRFLLAARLAFHPARSATGGLRLDLALEAGISRDSAAPLGGLISSFAGRRRLLGGDLRAEWGGWLMAFETIGAWLDFNAGGSRTPRGWYLTGGRMFTPTLQVLARWERFEADGLGADENLLLLGWQFRPNDAVRFRLHYALPLSSDPLGRQRIVGGAQLAL